MASLSSYSAWYLILIGVIAIIMTLRVRQGLWGCWRPGPG
jgi:hypothetical protein